MLSGRIRTQGLTEGAILAALVAIFAVAGRYIPLISLATTFLCPLPLAILVIRHGFRVAGIAAIVAVLVGTVLAGPLVGLAILVSFAPMGIVLGIGARQGWPAPRVVAAGTVVASVSTALSFLGLLGGGRLSMDEMARSMERSAAMTVDLYARLGIPATQIEGAMQPMREFARLLPYLLPLMLVLTAATTSWLNYEVGRRVLGRFGYRLHTLPPMRTWRVPPAGVWLVPVGFILLVGGARVGVPAVQNLGFSLVLGAMFIFIFQGLVAGWVILGNFGFGKIERVLAVWLALALPPLSPLLFILGMLDTIYRVRDRWGLERSRAGSLGAKP
ncbi:MAG: YybS family protein [bacterium]